MLLPILAHAPEAFFTNGDDESARLRENAAHMALKPGTDVAAQAILSLIRT